MNDNRVTLDANNQFPLSAAEGTQKIVVTDKAGNVAAEIIVTVNDGHRGGTATCTSKAVCVYCGNGYGEVDSNNHNLENIPAKDATVTETGNKEYWHCKDCENNFSDKEGKNSIELKDTIAAKLPPEIIEGTEQSLPSVPMRCLAILFGLSLTVRPLMKRIIPPRKAVQL